jgi:hypothetical protein
VGAEGFAPPAVVVDEAALGDEPTGVVIDPVAGKGAGADQPRLGAAVDVDGQGKVDQVTGPVIWTYGSWRTRRGTGKPT